MTDSRPDNRQLRQTIRVALQSRCSKALERIRVDVDDAGWVTLEGEVENWNERQQVETTVAGVSGVQHVDCRLIVDE